MSAPAWTETAAERARRDVVRLGRQMLERELADIEGKAQAIEDDSPSDALSRAGMYAGLIAADLGTLARAGDLEPRQLELLGDVHRALTGLLRVIDHAHTERQT